MPDAIRKYGVGAATGTKIGRQHFKYNTVDYATGSDWTPVAGDVKISIDEGAEANIGTLPTYTNGWWVYTFSAAEWTGKSIRVKIVDAATKAISDDNFILETEANASAMWPPDYANSTNLGMSNLDVTVSSRMATFTYTAPPSVASIAAQITIDHGSGSYVGGGPAITIDNDAIQITG